MSEPSKRSAPRTRHPVVVEIIAGIVGGISGALGFGLGSAALLEGFGLVTGTAIFTYLLYLGLLGLFIGFWAGIVLAGSSLQQGGSWRLCGCGIVLGGLLLVALIRQGVLASGGVGGFMLGALIVVGAGVVGYNLRLLPKATGGS